MPTGCSEAERGQMALLSASETQTIPMGTASLPFSSLLPVAKVSLLRNVAAAGEMFFFPATACTAKVVRHPFTIFTFHFLPGRSRHLLPPLPEALLAPLPRTHTSSVSSWRWGATLDPFSLSLCPKSSPCHFDGELESPLGQAGLLYMMSLPYVSA